MQHARTAVVLPRLMNHAPMSARCKRRYHTSFTIVWIHMPYSSSVCLLAAAMRSTSFKIPTAFFLKIPAVSMYPLMSTRLTAFERTQSSRSP